MFSLSSRLRICSFYYFIQRIMIFVTDIRKKHDQKRHGVIILFFNLPIDKVYRKITPQKRGCGEAAEEAAEQHRTVHGAKHGADLRNLSGQERKNQCDCPKQRRQNEFFVIFHFYLQKIKKVLLVLLEKQHLLVLYSEQVWLRG